MTFEEIISKKQLTGKQNSQIATLNKINENFGFNPISIVETGCIRNPTDRYKMGDGWTTLTWLLWAEHTDSRVYTIDIDKECLDIARSIVGNTNKVHFVHSDSVKFFKELPKNFKIDLLFLDSYDWIGDSDNKTGSEVHQLSEIVYAMPSLHNKSLILLDDVFDDGDGKIYGKGNFSIPFLLSNGWKIIHHIDTQVLFERE